MMMISVEIIMIINKCCDGNDAAVHTQTTMCECGNKMIEETRSPGLRPVPDSYCTQEGTRRQGMWEILWEIPVPAFCTR